MSRRRQEKKKRSNSWHHSQGCFLQGIDACAWMVEDEGGEGVGIRRYFIVKSYKQPHEAQKVAECVFDGRLEVTNNQAQNNPCSISTPIFLSFVIIGRTSVVCRLDYTIVAEGHVTL